MTSAARCYTAAVRLCRAKYFDMQMALLLVGAGVLGLLLLLVFQGTYIMATAAEIRALVTEIKGIASEVAGDLDEVIGKLEGGVSEADATAIAAELAELRDQLRGVADKVPEPVEPPPVE